MLRPGGFSSDPSKEMAGIFEQSLTMRTMNMLERGMDASLLRRRVLADNMANVSVPHFKRSEVSFEADLKRAVESERVFEEQSTALRTSDPLHFPRSPSGYRDYRQVTPRVHVDYLSSMRNDGNNVDMEDESMKVVRNQLHYSLLANRIGNNFRQLNQLVRLA